MSDEAKWYVIHTYSGHENNVKANLEKIVENRGMEHLIVDAIVPTEEVTEIKNGKKIVKKKKKFPGYCLVKMVMTDETWYIVRNTRGVTGFVGAETKPIPLTDKEITNMGIEKMPIKIDVSEGDNIRVISGPFDGFEGVVKEISFEKQILSVVISMFGRETPVEVEFIQIEKID